MGICISATLSAVRYNVLFIEPNEAKRRFIFVTLDLPVVKTKRFESNNIWDVAVYLTQTEASPSFLLLQCNALLLSASVPVKLYRTLPTQKSSKTGWLSL